LGNGKAHHRVCQKKVWRMVIMEEDIQKKFDDELTVMETLTTELKGQMSRLIQVVILFGFAFFLMILVLLVKVFQ
jgi:hypothetical protein